MANDQNRKAGRLTCMRTRVPRSLTFVAWLCLLAAGGPAFPPSAPAQAAQTQVSGLAQLSAPAGLQRLRGQVPAVLARLQPMGRLAATNRLKLAIGLPLRNQPALAQLLQELSDPAHPNYRHYLKPEEFAARFGPSEADYQAVVSFAQANGLAVSGRHPNRVLLNTSNPRPVAFIENPGDGSFRLSCDGVPGWACEFQYADDLSNPVWENVITATADACGTCEYLDWPPTNTPTRFYRAILP